VGLVGMYMHIKKNKKFSDYLKDIPFNGQEKRPPTGKNPDGTFKDYNSSEKDWKKEEFIIEFGVDPDLYLKWRDAGKPKPSPDLRC
jgi:hypothetical protein